MERLFKNARVLVRVSWALFILAFICLEVCCILSIFLH
jgi:hypothetical protein